MLLRATCLSSCLGLVATLSLTRAENWPAWRGPRADGTSLETNVPIHWGAASNVFWSAEVPGNGHASPIVWGDRIFTVTAVLESGDRVLLCLDRTTGKTLWQNAVVRSPLEKKHTLNSYASSTPATDGEAVYVAFLDREEMVVAGRLLWISDGQIFIRGEKHLYCIGAKRN